MSDEAQGLVATVLYTAADGRARFRDVRVPLDGGSAAARLSDWMKADGCQLRRSPPGFSSEFHCSTVAQWLVVLQGCMEIELQDGSTRRFGPGQFFYSGDTLPAHARFDPRVHGHRSRQLGEEPLVTLFVRAESPETFSG